MMLICHRTSFFGVLCITAIALLVSAVPVSGETRAGGEEQEHVDGFWLYGDPPAPWPKGARWFGRVTAYLLTNDRQHVVAVREVPSLDGKKDICLWHYLNDLQDRINQLWHRTSERHSYLTWVECEIRKDGQLSEAAVTGSSGFKDADKVALDAVRASSPAPAPPAGCPDRVPIAINFQIEYKPSERTMTLCRKLKKGMSSKQVIAKLGPPDKDVGGDSHVYIYELADGSSIHITCAPSVKSIEHHLPGGKVEQIGQI